jgi:hypothetical protein
MASSPMRRASCPSQSLSLVCKKLTPLVKYDTSLGGYRTNITEEQLKGAPKFSGTSWDWEDRERGRQVYDYYGASWIGY